ncbi:MAG: DUF2911 domain-containing protein, partial [Acidobacteria bacterium]|nr:DUF2911 domain-containing protein [Acidobacteriota bacterium]
MRLDRLSRPFLAVTVAALSLALALPALAGRGDDAKRKSKNGLTTGTIDGVEVTLEYGRPNVNGREIWGALVPYGKVWRTGADEATTVTFSADVTVQGQALPAGTYALFTIPEEGEWTIIFNKTANQWGAFSYDATQDALHVKATPASTDAPVEAMEFL